jgi:hypothetical protein
LRGDWENPSRSDLLLIRKAIKEGWPVPRERQRLLMDAVMALIHREDTNRSDASPASKPRTSTSAVNSTRRSEPTRAARGQLPAAL